MENIKQRHAVEEEMRTKVYEALDTAITAGDGDSLEHQLWLVIHEKLCQLAEHYSSLGFEIFRH